jgi:hypothetical protein
MEMLKDQNYPDVEHITMKTLPKIGYIALIQGQPVAAGFLRKVEGNIVAQLDGLTSNPYFGSIIRHQGISKVVDQLIYDAKALKLKGLIAFTVDKGILERAEAIGFHRAAHSVIALSF